MTIISPTIGRVVWYYPSSEEKTGLHLRFLLHGDGPLSASIAHINENGTLNLGVLDSSGNHHSRPAIALVQDGDTPPAEAAYATWMPFQVGQAAKTEQAQQLLQTQAQLQAAPNTGTGTQAPGVTGAGTQDAGTTQDGAQTAAQAQGAATA